MKKIKKKYDELRKRIVAKYGTMDKFAQAIGFSATTLSNKLNDKSTWRLNDIASACQLLDIPSAEISIFFNI